MHPSERVRRFTPMADHLFGIFKTMMTLTKTGKRDTVNGDCGCFSLPSYDRGTAHHGAVRCFTRGAPVPRQNLVRPIDCPLESR